MLNIINSIIKNQGDLFICQLSSKMQNSIKSEIEKYNTQQGAYINIDEVMCNRISLLQEMYF